tara:strand:+ start:162 stop:578 length:417 start_codon:yes stop_codon:yes gene_type:complete
MEAGYRARAEKIVTGSIGKQMRMTVEAATEGRCVVRMPTKGAVQNEAGRVHGGAITALIDNAATAAAWSYEGLGKDAWGTTISLTCNFLDAGKTADLIADAQVKRRGRSTVFIEINVSDAANRAIAQGLVTYKLSPGT